MTLGLITLSKMALKELIFILINAEKNITFSKVHCHGTLHNDAQFNNTQNGDI
jgi:hypothetical protein